MPLLRLVSDNSDPRLCAGNREIDEMCDHELVELLTRRQPDALRVLFSRYNRLVMSIALKVLRDHGEAEDLMQEVFLDVYRTADRFDSGRGAAKTWLAQIAHHKALARRRYLNLRRFYDHQEVSDFEISVNTFANGWKGLTFREWGDIIEKALATLNDKQRVTLQLAYFDGLTLRAIAASIDESLPNVRHHYYRGMEKLRQYLLDRSCMEQEVSLSRQEAADVKA